MKGVDPLQALVESGVTRLDDVTLSLGEGLLDRLGLQGSLQRRGGLLSDASPVSFPPTARNGKQRRVAYGSGQPRL